MDGITELPMNIYDRQLSIKGLQIPEKAVIIGCGGVGSWVSLFLALSGCRKIVLVDFDSVEAVNLNRSPYRLEDIGKKKVQALAEILLSYRMDYMAVEQWDAKYEELQKVFLDDKKNPNIVFLDCRDVHLPVLKEAFPLHIGNNGRSVSGWMNPNMEAVWGESVSYTDGAFLMPQILNAWMLCMNVLFREDVKKSKSYNPTARITIDVVDLLNKMFGEVKKIKKPKVIKTIKVEKPIVEEIGGEEDATYNARHNESNPTIGNGGVKSIGVGDPSSAFVNIGGSDSSDSENGEGN
jgi:hypothetical protein